MKYNNSLPQRSGALLLGLYSPPWHVCSPSLPPLSFLPLVAATPSRECAPVVPDVYFSSGGVALMCTWQMLERPRELRCALCGIYNSVAMAAHLSCLLLFVFFLHTS